MNKGIPGLFVICLVVYLTAPVKALPLQNEEEEGSLLVVFAEIQNLFSKI